MDYKEKYEAALKAAKEGKSIEEIFPEIAESEDEKIRKDIIHIVETYWGNQKNIREKYVSWLEKQKDIIEEYEDKLDRCACESWDKGYKEGKKECEWSEEDEKNWRHCLHYIDAYVTPVKEHVDWFKNIKNRIQPQPKQGEQKPIDKAESKFKVGDWIINNDKRIAVPIQILKIEEYGYITSSGYTSFDKVKTDYHLWTIQDAKDGDVLYSLDSNQPFIYKERNIHEQATAYCGINKYGNFFVWNTKDCIITLDKYIPAAKEQRALLFQKMKEAGYEWDAEKKELKKIEQKPVEQSNDYDRGYRDGVSAVEFNNKWSEEDEKRIERIVSFIWKNRKGDTDEIFQQEQDANWLMTFVPQPKQELTEEDNEVLNTIISDVTRTYRSCGIGTDEYNIRTKALDFLKSIKDKPKQDWSEEDEKNLNKAAIEWNGKAYFSPIAMILDSKGNPNGTKRDEITHGDSFKAGAEWVLNQYKFSKTNHWKPSKDKKETKNKCPNYSEGYGCSISPLKQCDTCHNYKLYNHWKPSEEQMSLLLAVINEPNNASSESCHLSLKKLYDELKLLHDYE